MASIPPFCLRVVRKWGFRASFTRTTGFAEHGAVFGAAHIKGVGEAGKVRGGQVTCRAFQSGAQACAVQEEVQAVGTAAVVEGGKLGLGIDGADLRGLGDVDQAGPGGIFLGIVPEGLLHKGGGHFTVGGGVGEDLMAEGLDGAGFMAGDMAAFHGDGGFIGAGGPGRSR